MLPGVTTNKSDGNTGVVRPSAVGICAIIATCASLAANTPTAETGKVQAFADCGNGILPEWAAYVLQQTGKPTLLINPTCSTAATYGSITETNAPGSSPSTITAGSTHPLDDFNVLITWLTAGTVGSAGITYNYSLDGGVTKSPTLALGTANTLTIQNSGVSFALGAGAIAAGQTTACKVVSARMTNTDLETALEALRVTKQPWEVVLIQGDADATTVATVDAWLAELEAVGKFKTAILCARPKNSGESEAAYESAMATAFSSASSIRLVVCADVGDVPVQSTTLQGITTMPRSAGLAVAARAMKIDPSEDPAYVDRGPVNAFALADVRGNPNHHDESSYPGLDDLRLTTLRTLDGEEGTFITNANILSSSGSDYVYLQHARCMNIACADTFQVLQRKLSKGIQKDPKTGFIAETEAQALEAAIQSQLDRDLVNLGRVTAASATIKRDDDLSSNAGATINADVSIDALAYVKKFNVTTSFVRTIAVAA